jgi:predicted MPP superfamily phosphohydrolase
VLRVLTMLLVATGVSGAAALYVGARLVGPLPLGGPWRGIAWAVVTVPAAGWPWLLVLRHYFPGAWAENALAVVYVALGVFSFLFTFTILRDAAWAGLAMTAKVARIVTADGGAGAHTLLAAGAWHPPWLPASSLAVVALSLAATGIGAIQATRPRLAEVTIPVRDLAPGLDGLRIAQISDLHLGTLTPAGFLATVVSRVNALHPDLVAITGDLADATVAERGAAIRPLAGLAAPAYFITGNHEHYWGAGAWCDAVAACGVTVLRGEHRLVRHHDATLLIAGVDDPAVGERGPHATFLPATALAGAPGADFRLLLAHRPTMGYAAAQAGVDLQLAGHTHGGQFFPWNLLVNHLMPFSPGLHRYGDTWIYTSRGTGFWGPPVRLGAPAEITLLTLQRTGS